jgi:hypothetical protein
MAFSLGIMIGVTIFPFHVLVFLPIGLSLSCTITVFIEVIIVIILRLAAVRIVRRLNNRLR